METINIIDKEKEIKDKEKQNAISRQAELFTNSVISTETTKNWNTIFDQQRQILSLYAAQTDLNLDMMKREKKREAQHRDEIERLKDQIESLAQQVGRLSKNNK